MTVISFSVIVSDAEREIESTVLAGIQTLNTSQMLLSLSHLAHNGGAAHKIFVWGPQPNSNMH